MKTFEVSQSFFNWAIVHLAGGVFHRVENGRYYLKPLKSYETYVTPFELNPSC